MRHPEREDAIPPPPPTEWTFPPNSTNSLHLTLDVANNIFQQAQPALDVSVKAISEGVKLKRDP